jgi:hypothetical protein
VQTETVEKRLKVKEEKCVFSQMCQRGHVSYFGWNGTGQLVPIEIAVNQCEIRISGLDIIRQRETWANRRRQYE